MLQAYISNDNQHIRRFDKQKLISAAVVLGNAALSLEWVEWRRKIFLCERLLRYLFIFLLLICDSQLRLAPFGLNAVKHRVFRKSAAALTAFRLKRLSLEIVSTTVIASEFMLCTRKVSRCKQDKYVCHLLVCCI